MRVENKIRTFSLLSDRRSISRLRPYHAAVVKLQHGWSWIKSSIFIAAGPYRTVTQARRGRENGKISNPRFETTVAVGRE